MFDLEKAIRDWNHTLARAESVSDDNVQELEEHLREIIAELVGKGLTQKEAFTVGKARLGESSALNREYSKVNGSYVWRRRILWMLLGYVGGSAFATAISGIAALTGGASSMMGLSGSWAGAVATTAAVVCWSILLLFLYHLSSRGDYRALGDHVSVGLVVALCMTMVIGRGIVVLSAIVHTRFVEVSEFGDYALSSSIGTAAVGLFVFVSCVGMIFVLKDRSVKQSTVVT